VKHYLDRNGNEVIWQGVSMQINDHEYYCAHHPTVLLAPITLQEALEAECARQHGGQLYQCWLCQQEKGRTVQPLLNEGVECWNDGVLR
jgi:hypothetical protein